MSLCVTQRHKIGFIMYKGGRLFKKAIKHGIKVNLFHSYVFKHNVQLFTNKGNIHISFAKYLQKNKFKQIQLKIENKSEFI